MPAAGDPRRVRALLLVLLLLGPALARAEAEGADLVVLLRPGRHLDPLPDGARPLAVLDAVVVPHASAALEARLRNDPAVLSVHRAEPLERTSLANLRLTRADPAPVAPAGGLTGEGVTVAVVDSGIDATHPDLAGRVKANVRLTDGRFVDAPTDLDGHGTHVAGIVAASGATSEGTRRGVAPGASLVGIDISERFTTTSALLAYDWLYVHRETHDVRVVVNAWGRVGERTYDPNDPVIRAIDRLVDAGVVVLFSASNHGPGASTLSVEAQSPRVVTVGAVDVAARVMPYSARGPVAGARDAAWVKPDVVAPGEDVVSLRSLASPPKPNDVGAFHRAHSGTSQAVPHVAGVVALMLQANPALTPAQVQNAIRESAVDLGAPGPDDATGFGLVDAKDAVRRALGLAPDRGNVLVAGGIDRHHDAARVQPPTGNAGLLGLAGGGAATTWTTEFPVKTGATTLTFDVGWDLPATGATVTLERDGEVQGAWTQGDTEGARVAIRGRIDAPEPGLWTLRTRAAIPLQVHVDATIDVHIQANATRALELDSRYRLPDTPRSALASALTGDFQAAVLQGKLFLRAYPGTIPSAAAGYMLAFLLLGRRRGA